jgi:hypothetical protein
VGDDIQEYDMEKLATLQNIMLYLRTNYSLREEKNQLNSGSKEGVRVYLKVFNGTPQIIFYFGKTPYTFVPRQRAAPMPYKALTSITGYQGIGAIAPGILAKYFTAQEIATRQAELKVKGV